jgi:hypothetical protein
MEAMGVESNSPYQLGFMADWLAEAPPVQQECHIHVHHHFHPGEGMPAYSYSYIAESGDACQPHSAYLACRSEEAGSRKDFDERALQMAQLNVQKDFGYPATFGEPAEQWCSMVRTAFEGITESSVDH